MGLFDIFKKKEQPKEEKKGDILLAMPMYNDGESFDAEKVIKHLKEYWQADISNIEEGNTLSFSIDGETIVMAPMQMAIPWSDLATVIPYAYNWVKAEEDLKRHDNHLIVTNIGSTSTMVKRFTTFTKVLATILATSEAIGIHNGLQSLLIPKKQFIESAKGLKEDMLPIDLWVYIGLRNTPTGRNAYTYGLKAFGKLEMEVIDSQMSLEDLYNFFLNISRYVIKSDVNFQAGQTLGYTAEQKIKISKSKGIFTEGETFKLEM